MRIVSLLPSATEIVCAIGLEDELSASPTSATGRRRSSASPSSPAASATPCAGARRATSTIGYGAMHGGSSLYALDEEALAAAEPDLDPHPGAVPRVRRRATARSTRSPGRIDADISVVSLEPTSIEGILNTISTVGAMTEAEDEAMDVVGSLRERLGADRDPRRRTSPGRASRHPGRRRGVARPAVRGRPLGARADPARRRLGPARAGRRALGRDDLGRRGGGGPGHAPAHAVRLPPRGDGRRVGAHAAAQWYRELDRGRSAGEVSPWTVRPTSAGPARGSSMASRPSTPRR